MEEEKKVGVQFVNWNRIPVYEEIFQTLPSNKFWH
jgi:hypothetical protein